MNFKDGFPTLVSIFKRYRLTSAGLRRCNCGELRLTVAVSVGEKTDGEEEGFAAGVNKVGDVVGAEIMMLAL